MTVTETESILETVTHVKTLTSYTRTSTITEFHPASTVVIPMTKTVRSRMVQTISMSRFGGRELNMRNQPADARTSILTHTVMRDHMGRRCNHPLMARSLSQNSGMKGSVHSTDDSFDSSLPTAVLTGTEDLSVFEDDQNDNADIENNDSII